jgi:hypothetical protein
MPGCRHAVQPRPKQSTDRERRKKENALPRAVWVGWYCGSQFKSSRAGKRGGSNKIEAKHRRQLIGPNGLAIPSKASLGKEFGEKTGDFAPKSIGAEIQLRFSTSCYGVLTEENNSTDSPHSAGCFIGRVRGKLFSCPPKSPHIIVIDAVHESPRITLFQSRDLLPEEYSQNNEKMQKIHAYVDPVMHVGVGCSEARKSVLVSELFKQK